MRWDDQGVDGIHLLLGDASLAAGLIRLGSPKDHEALLGLGKLGVFLLDTICRRVGLLVKGPNG